MEHKRAKGKLYDGSLNTWARPHGWYSGIFLSEHGGRAMTQSDSGCGAALPNVVASNVVATSHMRLFKLIKMK